MRAKCTLFLRSSPTGCVMSDGKTQQFLYSLCEREKIGEVWATTNWLGIWAGAAAHAFYRAHEGRLRAGTALVVKVNRIGIHNHATGAELKCHIQSARLAPPRWPAAPTEAEAKKPSFNATRQSADHSMETTP